MYICDEMRISNLSYHWNICDPLFSVTVYVFKLTIKVVQEGRFLTMKVGHSRACIFQNVFNIYKSQGFPPVFHCNQPTKICYNTAHNAQFSYTEVKPRMILQPWQTLSSRWGWYGRDRSWIPVPLTGRGALRPLNLCTLTYWELTFLTHKRQKLYQLCGCGEGCKECKEAAGIKWLLIKWLLTFDHLCFSTISFSWSFSCFLLLPLVQPPISLMSLVS